MRQKHFFSILLMLVTISIGNVWADDVLYKTATFSTSYCTSNSSYTGSVTCTIGSDAWTATNAANNNGGWDYVKMGAKRSGSGSSAKPTTQTGTISTSAAYSEAITKIVVNGTIERAQLDSTKLVIASNSGFSNDVVKIAGPTTFTDGKMTFTVSSPVANRYYKLEFYCYNNTSTNGVVAITSVEYYKPAAANPTV